MSPEYTASPKPDVGMVEMNISNLCNLECLTCVRHAPDYIQPEPVLLNLQQFKVIVERFPELPKLQICGFSEPTMNKDLPEMITFAKESGVKHVEMFTNGTLLTEKMTSRLAKGGLDLLRTSIDGGDAETYRRVRGADLNKVIKNVRHFAEQTSVPVRMESVLSAHVANSVEKLPDVAAAVGAKWLSIRLLDGQDHNLEANSMYEPSYLKSLKEKLGSSCEKYGIELIMALPGEQDFASRCTAWDEVYVDETGGLVPCYLSGTKPVGNLLESTFDEIWETQGQQFLSQKEDGGGFLDSCSCNYALVAQNKVK